MSSYFLRVFDLPEGKLLEYLIDLKRSVEKKGSITCHLCVFEPLLIVLK